MLNDKEFTQVAPSFIPMGYIMLARQIKDSDIAHAPPCTREIWIWLLREVNHADNSHLKIKRGQTVRTIKDMQDALHWMVGYRKKVYSKSQCESALKYLRKNAMIITEKTTRGMLITVCNYDYYQDATNYEARSEHKVKAPRSRKQPSTINKNDKNDKNEIKESYKYERFYLDELKAKGAHYYEKDYKYIYELLFGIKDSIVKVNILSIEKQLSFNEFIQAKNLEDETKVSLIETLHEMEANKKLRETSNGIYNTLTTWMRRKANQKREKLEELKPVRIPKMVM